MKVHEYFCTLACYIVWATKRLLQACESLTDQQYRRDVGLFFKSIHGTLNHLLVGEHLLWYPRFAKGVAPKRRLEIEAEPDRERLAQALRGAAANWLALIESCSAGRFEGKRAYTTTHGQALSLPFAATLTHVFNHGTHHRGQITAARTTLEQPCPVLDLVVMLQEESKA
jgi:uncharacterized damage-inducible protein DinB